MSGFANLKQIYDAEQNGQYLYTSFRKAPTQTTGQGIWFDVSMSPGNPVPNYYIGSPGKFTTLTKSADGGLNHGQNVNDLGMKKFIRKLTIHLNTIVTGTTIKLCDYLGFYPFLDESVTDEQLLDNTASLTRYTDGAGVQLMPVVVAAQTGGCTFTVNYTNSDGVAGRISQVCKIGTQSVNGTVATSMQVGAQYYGPFIPLAAGDSGVRSVQSITFNSPGDIGLLSLVLIKPIAQTASFGSSVPALGAAYIAGTETDFLTDFSTTPEIKDDAYLNFVLYSMASLTGSQLMGTLETTWN